MINLAKQIQKQKENSRNSTFALGALVVLVAAAFIIGPNLTGYVTAASSPSNSDSNYVEMYLTPNSSAVPVGNSGYSIKMLNTYYVNPALGASSCTFNVTAPNWSPKVITVRASTSDSTKTFMTGGIDNALYFHVDQVTAPLSAARMSACKISAFVGKS